jgi:hypothetical protein
MRYVLNIEADCAGTCNRGLVPKPTWSALPKMIRLEIRANFIGEAARGLCHHCYMKSGLDVIDFQRKNLSLTDFAEEYNAFHESGMTDRYIAERLGMYHAARRWEANRMQYFNKRLSLAREKGLIT